MKTKKSNARHSTSKKRSAAVKATWNDRKVKQARSARHAVRVGGKQFRSVTEAFKALDLDLTPHQRVRRQLVIVGAVKHAGKRFTLAT